MSFSKKKKEKEFYKEKCGTVKEIKSVKNVIIKNVCYIQNFFKYVYVEYRIAFFQKQPPEVFCKKKYSYKFHKIHRKTPVPEFFCFPVNFMKFLRTLFSQNTSWWLLLFLELIISISISTTLLLWRKKRTSFKTLASKKTTIWRLKKSHSNDKIREKITSSSYHMEQKTFIEASYIYNMHTQENHFCSCFF